MTIKADKIVLWDDGYDKLVAYAIPSSSQYRYIEGKPCITVGFAYENPDFKGCDCFTFFDDFYLELLAKIRSICKESKGSIRLYDMGADTNGFINITAKKNGKLEIDGVLGIDMDPHPNYACSLKFVMNADQILLKNLLNCLEM